MASPGFEFDGEIAVNEALRGYEALLGSQGASPSMPPLESAEAIAGNDAGHPVPAGFDWTADDQGPTASATADPSTVDLASLAGLTSNPVPIGPSDGACPGAVPADAADSDAAWLDLSDSPAALLFAQPGPLPPQPIFAGFGIMPAGGAPAPADSAGHAFATAASSGGYTFLGAGMAGPGEMAAGTPTGAAGAHADHAPADGAHAIDPPASLAGGGSTAASIGSNGATPAQVQAAFDESGLSVNGFGVKVGVLSDSFDNLGGAPADEASGALPPANFIQVVSDLSSGGSDEGRAMMQIIHDIAPDASLAFYTAFNGEQDFANGILALAAAGCKVICDDVSYYDEPFFQTGVVAQAIQTVEAEGVTYVTAAGNDGSNGYQASWIPTSGSLKGISAPLTDAENFGGSLVQEVDVKIPLNSGYTVPLVLEWDQAYGKASSNLEVLVYTKDENGNYQLVGTATNTSPWPPQSGSGEPQNPWVEFDFQKTGTYYVAIRNLSGPDPTLIKYITAGDGLTADIIGANSGTVVGHAATAGAITAGAVDSKNTPAFGTSPPTSESFSSSGQGTELLFDSNGNPITPESLNPVTVSGVDDINTTVTGGLNDFLGTSAASASLAGVAALMVEANPSLSPAQVATYMAQYAAAMSDAAVAGAGLVQVNPTIAAIPSDPVAVTGTDSNAFGSTDIVESKGDYLLYDGATPGPALQYGGSGVFAGEFGIAWKPIDAAPTGSGYDVAWKVIGANEYWVWKVNAGGVYAGSIVTDVAANNLSLQVLELTFNKDLNGDGRIGPPKTDFVYDIPLGSSVDYFTNFNPAADRIVLSASDLPGIATIGSTLLQNEFHVGPKATAGSQRILYHPFTGFIDYHVINGGPTGLVHIAHVSPHLTLANLDFLVVA
jgi:hypothetical protein